MRRPWSTSESARGASAAWPSWRRAPASATTRCRAWRGRARASRSSRIPRTLGARRGGSRCGASAWRRARGRTGSSPSHSRFPRLRSCAELDEWEVAVADYASTGMTLGAHPLALIRHELEDAVVNADLAVLPDRRELEIAGIVVARQRPGTAKGVVFMLLEDETGVANVIVPPPVYTECRLAVRTASYARVVGRLERRGKVINVLASRVEPLSTPDLPQAEVRTIEPDPVRETGRAPAAGDEVRVAAWRRSRGSARRGRAGAAELWRPRVTRWATDPLRLGKAVSGTSCKGSCTPGRSVRARPHSAEPMFESKTKIRTRLVDTLDLVVDFATLGEYGLEPLEAAEEASPGGRCDQEGRRAGWEAIATPRRGSRCAPPVPKAGRVRGWLAGSPVTSARR